MRLMAIQTVFRGRVVLPLGFQRLLHCLVAGQTKIRTLGQQQKIKRRFVGVVAARTFAVGERRVGAHGGREILSNIVAFHANRGLVFGKNARIRAGVRRVAGEALAAFERVMSDGAGVLLHQLMMALGAERRIDGPEQVAFIGAVAEMTPNAITAPYRRVHIGLEKLVFELRMA